MKSLFLDVIPMPISEEFQQQPKLMMIWERVKGMNLVEWVLFFVGVFSVIAIIYVILVIVKVLRNKV